MFKLGYIPRFWLDIENNREVYIPNQEQIFPSQPHRLRIDNCPRCDYEICSTDQKSFHESIHYLYYRVSWQSKCGSDDPSWILKKDKQNYYDNKTENIGLDPYALNETATLFYLQSFPEYTEQRWFERFSELQQTFICADTPNLLCRLYPFYPVSLKQWRENNELDSTSLIFISQDLLTSLQILAEKSIVHRGISPKNVFLTEKKTVILGGWSHASLNFTKDDSPFQIDNLIYTSVTSETKMIDRVLLANTIYYCLYQKEPPHVLQWFRNFSVAQYQEMAKESKFLLSGDLQKQLGSSQSMPLIDFLKLLHQKNLVEQMKFLIKKQMEISQKLSSVEWYKPNKNSKSEVELAILRLIFNLADSKLDLMTLKQQYESQIAETIEYKLEMEQRKSRGVTLLPVIREVIERGNELIKIQNEKSASQMEELRRRQQTAMECQELKESGLLNETIVDAPKTFFELKKAIDNVLLWENSAIPNLLLCTANSLFQRFRKSQIPLQEKITLFIAPKLQLIREEKKSLVISEISSTINIPVESIQNEVTVQIIDLIYWTALIISGKLYGFLFKIAEMKKWILGILLYILTRDKRREINLDVEKVKLLLAPDNQDFIIFYDRVIRLIANFEVALLKSLHFVPISQTYRALFEKSEICLQIGVAKTNAEILDEIQNYFPKDRDYVVLDIALLYSDDYSSSEIYEIKEVQQFAQELVTERKVVLEFLASFQNMNIFFIDDNDGIQMFNSTLLNTKLSAEAIYWAFRQEDTKTVSKSFLSIFNESLWGKKIGPDKDLDKTSRKYIEKPQYLAGYELHKYFFSQVQALLEDGKEKELGSKLNIDNVLTFHLKYYMFLLLKTEKLHPQIKREDLQADSLAWFSLIHGVGQSNLKFNITENKLISEVQNIDDIFKLLEKDDCEKTECLGYRFVPGTLNPMNFQPSFLTQGISKLRQIKESLLDLFTDKDLSKQIFQGSEKLITGDPEADFVNILSSPLAFNYTLFQRWNIHLFLIQKFMKKHISPSSKGIVFLNSMNDGKSLVGKEYASLMIENISSPVTLESLQQFRYKQSVERNSQIELAKNIQRKCSSFIGNGGGS